MPAAWRGGTSNAHDSDVRAEHGHPSRTADEGRRTLDLHGLQVREALQIVPVYLDHFRSTTISIVTGAGRHSADGAARLRPAVWTYLQGAGVAFHFSTRASFIVHPATARRAL